MLNNSQQNSSKKLSASHQLAVDLRLSGCSYQEIASKVKSKEQTVRSWFMHGGFCQETYEYKNKLLTEDRWVKMKQIETGIQNLASKALKVISSAVVKGDLKASIKILNMAGFGEVQKIQEVQPQEDEGLLLLRTIVKQIERESKQSHSIT